MAFSGSVCLKITIASTRQTERELAQIAVVLRCVWLTLLVQFMWQSKMRGCTAHKRITAATAICVCLCVCVCPRVYLRCQPNSLNLWTVYALCSSLSKIIYILQNEIDYPSILSVSQSSCLFKPQTSCLTQQMTVMMSQ